MAHIGEELALGDRRRLRGLLGRSKLFFRLLAIRDVEAGADVAGQRAVGVVKSPALVQDPAISAVMPPQSELHLEIGLAFEREPVVEERGFVVLGVDSFRPALTHRLVHGPSGEVEPDAIEVGAFRIRTRHPHHDGCLVGDGPEQRLVNLEALFLLGTDVQLLDGFAFDGFGLAQGLREFGNVLDRDQHVVALGLGSVGDRGRARERGHGGVEHP